MLECTAATREANSRLGCQLKAGRDFESLTVRIPERQ
jgi:2Fe-2S ferredoxin